MCLTIKRESHKVNEFGYTIPKIAKRDVTCYKWLIKNGKGALRSPYYPDRLYKIGQRMKVPRLGISAYSVHEGIHGYTNKKVAICNNEEMESVIVQCVIPKGASYIIGECKHIVATEIKLKRIIAEGGRLKKIKI